MKILKIIKFRKIIIPGSLQDAACWTAEIHGYGLTSLWFDDGQRISKGTAENEVSCKLLTLKCWRFSDVKTHYFWNKKVEWVLIIGSSVYLSELDVMYAGVVPNKVDDKYEFFGCCFLKTIKRKSFYEIWMNSFFEFVDWHQFVCYEHHFNLSWTFLICVSLWISTFLIFFNNLHRFEEIWGEFWEIACSVVSMFWNTFSP